MSVIEPSPWWPRIGIPLIFAMSTALPVQWCETLPEAVKYEWPQVSEVTVGRSPLAARNSSVASTRRSIREPSMSRRPQP